VGFSSVRRGGRSPAGEGRRVIATENEVTVSSTSYTAARDKWIGLPGADKITFTVTQAPVFVQMTERPDPHDYDEPVGSEILLGVGFQSIPLAKRVFSYRLRAQTGTPAIVTVRASG
jgi:hypothetical protein